MRYRHAAVAALAALLAVTSACSRSGSAPGPASAADKPSIPESTTKVEVPADAVVSKLAISSLPTSPVTGLTSKEAISAADDADRLKARDALVKLMEASYAAPAPGLEDALLAYYRRPDVAALPSSMADLRGTIRMNRFVGTKDDPGPADPKLMIVASIYEGASPWRIRILQWQAGGKVYTTKLREDNVQAFRPVTYQGRPAFLLITRAGSDAPVTAVAYEAKDGQLQPLPLPDAASVGSVTVTRVAPNALAFSNPKAFTFHPDFRWFCSADTCVSLDWADARGLAVKPAGFTPAEAQARLASTDGNRVATEWGAWSTAVGRRIASIYSGNESVAGLTARTGAAVSVAASGDATARILHITGMEWMNGKGYQLAANWVQWSSLALTYQAAALGGGAYIDHRVLQEGKRTYLLVLTEAEPRPQQANVLSLFVVEPGKMQRVQLPELFRGATRKSFLSMDGRLMLSCGTSVATTEGCEAIRLEDDNLVTLKASALMGGPTAEAKQADEEGTAKFKAGDYKAAANGFRKATELSPFYLDAWNDLSFAYQKAGDWSAALLAAQTAARIDPKSGPARFNMGSAYLALGNANAALAPLEEAVKLQPQSAITWMSLGRAREQEHLRITALEAYEKAKELDPSLSEAQSGINRIQPMLDSK